jgi:arylsulfatase A-like enzyme
MPGASLGLSFDDPSVGQFMKNFGYATGQFGKNHLGDRNEHLPTVHGFDEFFGNLYHLNAEEEPYYPNYPKDPAFRKRYGPRGVLKCKATDKDDPTIDPQFGKVGKQVIKNTGPLPKERMETVDEEFLAEALDFIDRKNKEGGPWFCYFNPTRMHIFTHLKKSSVGKTGLGLYPDGMVELDGYVGKLLKKLDDLKVADNTIVVFTTDNGAEVMSWPDGGSTPFRGEKDTNWEGGWRVPCVMRWPGVIEAGRVINDICSLQDFIPTFAAANGEPDLVEKVKKGYAIGDKTFKVHLDGYPAAVPIRQGREISARRLHLLERRRRLHGCAVGPLEGRFRRAAKHRNRRLARTAGADAHSEVLRLARRPLRARRGKLQIRRLVRRANVPHVRRAADARPMAAKLQGLPAARQAGQFQHRQSDGVVHAEIVELPLGNWIVFVPSLPQT